MDFLDMMAAEAKKLNNRIKELEKIVEDQNNEIHKLKEENTRLQRILQYETDYYEQ